MNIPDSVFEDLFNCGVEKYSRGGYYPLGYEYAGVNVPQSRIKLDQMPAKYEYIHAVYRDYSAGQERWCKPEFDLVDTTKWPKEVGGLFLWQFKVPDIIELVQAAWELHFPDLDLYEVTIRFLKYEDCKEFRLSTEHKDFSFLTAQIHDSRSKEKPVKIFFGEPASIKYPDLTAPSHHGHTSSITHRYAVVAFANPLPETILKEEESYTLAQYHADTLSQAQGDNARLLYSKHTEGA